MCLRVCVHRLTPYLGLCFSGCLWLCVPISLRVNQVSGAYPSPPFSLSLFLLSVSSPHPFLHLVAFPVSPVPVLLYRFISLCTRLSARLFSLLGFSYLREAEAPPLFQTMFLSFFLPLFLFLSLFPSLSTPLFCLCLSGSVIKSDSSLAENNKQHLLKSAMAV